MHLYTTNHREKKLIPRVDGHGKGKVASKKRVEYYTHSMPTANSWTRDNTTNNFLGNGGTELNTTSALYDLQYRNYDAVVVLQKV